MNLKAVALLILVVLALGAGIAFFVVYQQRQAELKAQQQLLQAEALIEAGSHEQAVGLLIDLRQRHPKFAGMAQVVFDLAAAYRHLDPDQAIHSWQELLSKYPDSPSAAEARRFIAQVAIDQGKMDLAEEHLLALKNSRRPGVRAEVLAGLGRVAEARGQIDEARARYEEVVDQYGGEPAAGEAMDLLSRLNTDLFLSPRVTEFSQRYEILPGDSLIVIGAKFDTTAYLIREINSLSGSGLRAGTRITVPKPGGVRLVVDKSEKRLYVYSQMEGTEGKFLKRYPVGVAKYAERTPPGLYLIEDKSIDPTWYPPDGGVIPAGDARNALGSRWMGFTQGGRDTSLGIHGTNDPSTIGTNSSAGCIRMHNSDVEQLFMIARQGTEVEIVE